MEEELKQLRLAAESGYMKAMCEYGKKLADSGKYDDALKWNDLSNDDVALDVLGTCLNAGNGTDKNIKEAINCFLKALELGEIDRVVPIFLISHIFDDHINFKEVVSVLETQNNNISTENAGADAIKFYNLLKFMLASCYYWGVGTKQNKERAKQLLMSAGYDFDMDKTPLLIKEIAMAYTFPNQIPICRDFFIPLLKNYFWLDTNKPFRTYYPFLKKYSLSEYSKTQDIYKFLIEQDDTNRWYYLQVASEKNANKMYDALKEGNYDKFSDSCLNEPNFAGYVFLYNKLKTNFQHSNYLPPFYCLDSFFEEDGDIDKYPHSYKSLLLIILISYSFNKSNLAISISSFIFSLTQSIFACFLILSIIKECNIASNLTKSENEKYKELTRLLNLPKYSKEINELKKYCIDTPEILDWLGYTKQENSTESNKVDDDYSTIIAILHTLLLNKNNEDFDIFSKDIYDILPLDKQKSEDEQKKIRGFLFKQTYLPKFKIIAEDIKDLSTAYAFMYMLTMSKCFILEKLLKETYKPIVDIIDELVGILQNREKTEKKNKEKNREIKKKFIKKKEKYDEIINKYKCKETPKDPWKYIQHFAIELFDLMFQRNLAIEKKDVVTSKSIVERQMFKKFVLENDLTGKFISEYDVQCDIKACLKYWGSEKAQLSESSRNKINELTGQS